MQASNIFEFLCNFNFKSSSPSYYTGSSSATNLLNKSLRDTSKAWNVFNRVSSCYNPASASLYRPTSVRASQIRFKNHRVTVFSNLSSKIFLSDWMDNVMAGSAWLKLFVEFLVLFEYIPVAGSWWRKFTIKSATR